MIVFTTYFDPGSEAQTAPLFLVRESSDLPLALPKFDVVTVHELPGSLACRLIVRAVKVNAKLDSVVFVQDVGAAAVAFHGGGSGWHRAPNTKP